MCSPAHAFEHLGAAPSRPRARAHREPRSARAAPAPRTPLFDTSEPAHAARLTRQPRPVVCPASECRAVPTANERHGPAQRATPTSVGRYSRYNRSLGLHSLHTRTHALQRLAMSTVAQVSTSSPEELSQRTRPRAPEAITQNRGERPHERLPSPERLAQVPDREIVLVLYN